jgi:hypothetical protein
MAGGVVHSACTAPLAASVAKAATMAAVDALENFM